MAVATIRENKQIITHAINNRLNTLSLGMTYLEDKSNTEERKVICALKAELYDLQELIEELKHHS